MGALIQMHVLAGRREIGIGLLVLEQYAVAVQENMRDKAGGIRERDPLLRHGGSLRLRGDGHVERLIGRLDVLGEIDVRNIERIAVIVEPVRGAVGRQLALERNPGQIEQIAERVLLLYARHPA